jgi:hypothetical protein
MLRFGSCPTSPCGTGRTGAGAGTGSWLWHSSPHPMGGQDAWSQRKPLNMEAITQRGVDCRALPCADHVLGTMLWDISSNVAERPGISKKTRPANTRRVMGGASDNGADRHGHRIRSGTSRAGLAQPHRIRSGTKLTLGCRGPSPWKCPGSKQRGGRRTPASPRPPSIPLGQ